MRLRDTGRHIGTNRLVKERIGDYAQIETKSDDRQGPQLLPSAPCTWGRIVGKSEYIVHSELQWLNSFRIADPKR